MPAGEINDDDCFSKQMVALSGLSQPVSANDDFTDKTVPTSHDIQLFLTPSDRRLVWFFCPIACCIRGNWSQPETLPAAEHRAGLSLAQSGVWMQWDKSCPVNKCYGRDVYLSLLNLGGWIHLEHLPTNGHSDHSASSPGETMSNNDVPPGSKMLTISVQGLTSTMVYWLEN